MVPNNLNIQFIIIVEAFNCTEEQRAKLAICFSSTYIRKMNSAVSSYNRVTGIATLDWVVLSQWHTHWRGLEEISSKFVIVGTVPAIGLQ